MKCPKCKKEVIKRGSNWFLKDMPILSHSFGCDYDLRKLEVKE